MPACSAANLISCTFPFWCSGRTRVGYGVHSYVRKGLQGGKERKSRREEQKILSRRLCACFCFPPVPSFSFHLPFRVSTSPISPLFFPGVQAVEGQYGTGQVRIDPSPSTSLPIVLAFTSRMYHSQECIHLEWDAMQSPVAHGSNACGCEMGKDRDGAGVALS